MSWAFNSLSPNRKLVRSWNLDTYKDIFLRVYLNFWAFKVTDIFVISNSFPERSAFIQCDDLQKFNTVSRGSSLICLFEHYICLRKNWLHGKHFAFCLFLHHFYMCWVLRLYSIMKTDRYQIFSFLSFSYYLLFNPSVASWIWLQELILDVFKFQNFFRSGWELFTSNITFHHKYIDISYL